MKTLTKKTANLLLIAAVLAAPFVSGAQGQSGNNKFYRPGDGGLISIPFFFNAPGPAGQTTFGGIVIVTLNIVLLVVGSLAVAFLIWGGLRYILASGNEEAAEKAKKTIMSAIIGLLIVVLSFTMITIITRFLITGSP